MPTGAIESPAASERTTCPAVTETHGDRRLVHLGCGPNCSPTCWTEYDGSWQVRLIGMPGWIRWLPRTLYRRLVKEPLVWPTHVKYLDLRKKLPFPPGSVDAIYASHVLEHLYRDEAKRLVAECHRVLKPGGMLRLAVPSLRYFAERYLASQSDDAADQFMRLLHVRSEQGVRNPLLRLYHLCGGDFHSHKWMYDAASLTLVFRSAGFASVRERSCHDSDIPEITLVESRTRVSPSEGFAVEGVKER